jgi:hypothetical protein
MDGAWDHSENLGVFGRAVLKWILRVLGGRVWIGFINLRMGWVAGCCEHVDELSDSMKGWEFLG